jgi:hypothetical protein
VRVRRALLAVALGVALAAFVATLAAPPRGGREAPAPSTSPRGAAAQRDTVHVAFDAGRDPPKRVTVKTGTQVVARVRTPRAGEVVFERLGLIETATPAAPASFDLLLEEAGSYDAVFRPTEGRARRVGTLVVEPGSRAAGGRR